MEFRENIAVDEGLCITPHVFESASFVHGVTQNYLRYVITVLDYYKASWGS